jgi:DNA-directed RNA polymerase sigma subunit (sigma70/sigma32)
VETLDKLRDELTELQWKYEVARLELKKVRDRYSQLQWRAQDLKNRQAERERRLRRYRTWMAYDRGASFSEIAETLKVSKERARIIYLRALRDLEKFERQENPILRGLENDER